MTTWIMSGRTSKLLLKLNMKKLKDIVWDSFVSNRVIRVGNRKSANFCENINKTIRKCHTMSH